MIEYEVTIPGVDLEEARRRLQESGAVLEKPMTLHRNTMFHLPAGREIRGGWLRVREESGRVTMSLKIIDGEKMTDQQEYLFMSESADAQEACTFLSLLGAVEKARSEKRRETWQLRDCEVVIDQWPFLEPLLEIEGPSEAAVMAAVEKLGYGAQDCRVCAVDVLYREKYGVAEDIVDNHTPRIIFDMLNPFLKQ